MLTRLIYFICFLILSSSIDAQVFPKAKPNRFDFGKMWTFEHAPLDYFEKTYNFRPSNEWLEKTRLSAIRFASYCSGSFISPDGLILTNHHCSRGEVIKVMQEGEDFDANGYYAATQAEERQVPGLFVKQLRQMADITDKVTAVTKNAKGDDEFARLREEAFKQIIATYEQKAEWKGLELETVTYYSGGKYSLYGYKRYDDIRLVLIPEQIIGYFGGDPDNFTYPRYNLDFTIWRAYENGQPVNTSDHYFPVDVNGPKEDRPVFAVSNPASTERYRTVAQLKYDRDARYNVLHQWLSNRVDIMKSIQAETPSPQLEETIFNYSNGIKAYGGIIEGLHDPYLMGKKEAMERDIRAKSQAVRSGSDHWASLEKEYEELMDWGPEVTLLSPTPLNGYAYLTAVYFDRYIQAMESGEASAEDLAALKTQVKQAAAALNQPKQDVYLNTLLTELQTYANPTDTYLKDLLGGKSASEFTAHLFKKTDFTNEKKLDKLLDKKLKKLKKSKDPIAKLARHIVPQFQAASSKFRSSSPKRKALEGKIANEIYQIYGLSIPPDASFTLRLADGVVKSYSYNGTEAPTQTTFFGLYDRYYSYGQQFPWNLPERWLNPNMDLLKTPINFILTTDSIGGSSGSPIVNEEGKLVGLLFDGNIESLSGNFIYDSKVNRSVAVHAAGIVAALKHVYQADRLLQELKQ